MQKLFLFITLLCCFVNKNYLFATQKTYELDSLIKEQKRYSHKLFTKNEEEIDLQILKLATEQNNKNVQVFILNELSILNENSNNFIASYNYSEQAISIASELKKDTILVDLFLNRSKLFSKIGNMVGAIKYLIKVRKLAFKINTNYIYKDYYNALANFYYNQKKYDKAIDNFKLALLKATYLNDTISYLSSFDNIGLCYRNLGNYKLAEYYFLKAIYFSEECKSTLGLINAGINLSKNYLKSNQITKALESSKYLKSLIKSHDIPNKFKIEASLNLARIYLQKKDFENTSNELKYIDDLLKQNKVLNEDKIEYLELLYKKQKGSKNPSYIITFEEYLKAKDSLQDLKKIILENSINDKFTIAEKLEDYDNIEQSLEIKKMENKLTIIIGILFLVGLVILLYIIYNAKKNIKEMKLLQIEVENKNKNLELFNKQKDYILATVAHDLRGPVGNINTITGVFSMDDTLDEEQKTLIDLINQSADLSMNIINDLVDAINVDRQIELFKQDKIVLFETINSVVKMQENILYKKNISVNIDCFPGIEIKGDRSYIIRVLINLISNAVKFSNFNTIINIETSLYDEDNVLIKIKDHGIGIDDDKLETVFEPFTSASRRGVAGEKSIGLGLSICKKIIELHYGKIWAESKINEGSTFFIVLPINYLNKILKKIPFEF